VTDATGARQYRLIDSDAHVNEPPELWLDRVPAKFKDRAPRIEHLEQGDGWILEGVDGPINFGLNAAAGLPVQEHRPWVRFDEIRAGGYNPKARLDEMDADRIDAAVLYPTPRLSQSLFANQDPEFHLSLVQAYNDWLVEFCSEDPSRLGAIVIIPNRGLDQASAELDRLAGNRAVKGALIGCYPHGDLDIKLDDDAIWNQVVDAGLPLHVHVSMVNSMPSTQPGTKYPGDVRFYDAPQRVLQFIWSGVFDRIPELQLVIAEVDCGWVPFFKEQVDDRYWRLRLKESSGLKNAPSHYMEHNISFTYISDHFAIRNRHDIGVDRMMWSSDFPHVPANWPESWRVIEAAFDGVPRDERHLIVAGNAQRLYGFGA
jgi:predicted TIM-barrel fold metal-dependent hydrolase